MLLMFLSDKTDMKPLLLVAAFFTVLDLYGQDDLLGLLEESERARDEVTIATFKGTRIINGHSVETRNEGVLDFIISHRFGTLNSGAYELWGLDQSNIRLALEYAFFEDLMVGLGRSSFEKTYDAFLKYKLFKQKTGTKNIPVSAVLFASTTIKTLRRFDGFEPTFIDKLANTTQLLVARKITPELSIQLSPTYIYYHLIEANEKRNDVAALGIGGRYKITSRVTFNAEYFYQFFNKNDQFYHDAIAVGVDIETGGHVFQLQFTNATAMIEKGFIGETRNDFFGGDIHFGFNISRAFQLK